MEDLYFEVNPKRKYILHPPKKLDINWNSIFGITLLSKEELQDLSWAGYENIGFIKLSKENAEELDRYKSNYDVIDYVRTIFKREASQNRSFKENSFIVLNNKTMVQLSSDFKLSLLMKYIECKEDENLLVNWKTVHGYIELSSKNIIDLFKNTQKYIQKLYDIEKMLYEKIDSCTSISELFECDLQVELDNNFNI